jgi:putative membrane protein
MNFWVDASGWPVPPFVLITCLVAEILYFRGLRILVKGVQAKRVYNRGVNAVHLHGHDQSVSADGGRSVLAVYPDMRSNAAWNRWHWRGIIFLCAILAFLLAASVPIDNLSGRFFWVHMIQHLLLLVVTAPLLVAAAPLLPLWLGLPRWARRLVKASAKPSAGRAFYWLGYWLVQQPAIACVLFVIGIWIWHWPTLYDLALTNIAIHDWCEHATFLAVSLLFWAQVIPSQPLRLTLGFPGRICCVGVAIAQNLVFSVLIAFAQTPLYAPYAHLVTGPGGLSALQDQQLGAGIMWTFGDLPFGIALSMLVHRWLTSQSDETDLVIQSR